MKKTRWLSPFRFVVPSDYERWLESLASQGWHPCCIGQWSSIAMRFEKGEPKTYRYVVDLQAFPTKEYRDTYEAFGWEFVGQMASMMVWRRAYTGERPESFSDPDSRRCRNRRFIGAVSVSFILFMTGALAALGAVLFARLSESDRVQFGLMAAFLFILAAALGLVMLKLRKNIEK